MTGEVSAYREARLSVDVTGEAGAVIHIEAVLDTGFTEFLTLPPTLIASLALPYDSDTEMVLASGSIEHVSVYRGRVLWDGRERAIQVHASDGDILLGMSLLHGHHLAMDVVDGGRVTISPLP